MKKILFLLIPLFLISCSFGEKDWESDNLAREWDEELTDGVYVDFSLQEDYPENQIVYLMKNIKEQELPSEEELVKLKEDYFPEDSSAYIVEFWDDPTDPGRVLNTENGTTVIVGKGLKAGSTEKYNFYSDFLFLETGEGMPVNVSGTEELDFMKREELERQIREKLPVYLMDSFEIYEMDIRAYPVDYLEKLTNALEKSNYREFVSEEVFQHEWKKEDEIYKVHVIYKCGELPVDDEGIYVEESYIPAIYAEFLFSPQGLINFNIQNSTDIQEEENIKIWSCNRALRESVKGKYENIIMANSLCITEAILQYDILPNADDGRQYLTPVWKFRTQVYAGKGMKNMIEEQFIHVNAVTGQVIG